MRVIIFVLFIGILARHVVPNWIWQGTGISQSGWLYIFGGLLEVLFCGVLLHIAKNIKTIVADWEAMQKKERALWRLIFIYSILIGVSEGAQISVCRIAVANFGDVPKGANLCDFAAVANFNFLVNKFAPSLSQWLRISRDTLPLTPTIYSIYFFSFMYHFFKIRREKNE